MKTIITALSILLGTLATTAQSGYMLKYKQTTNKMVSDTLQVTYMDGNSMSQLGKSTVGKTSYKSMKLKSTPAVNYVLYPDNSYRMLPDVQVKDYSVTVIGKEMCNGYNCTKVSVQTFINGNISYLWLTNDIAESKNMSDIIIVDLKLERITDALKQQNVTGFPVKIAYKIPDYITYELVKVQACTLPDALFDLGKYTNAKPVTEAK